MGSAKLQKKRQEYLEALGLAEHTVVHFDISRTDARKRWVLHRFLHGREEERMVNGSVKCYRYGGLLHEGGKRLGQSVYMLPPDLASRLIVMLRKLGVSHEWWDVYARLHKAFGMASVGRGKRLRIAPEALSGFWQYVWPKKPTATGMAHNLANR